MVMMGFKAASRMRGLSRAMINPTVMIAVAPRPHTPAMLRTTREAWTPVPTSTRGPVS